ncbi:ABC transporter substrate-binding protein [Amycolatopsis sp. NPDC098790]|uniref:ABC transporter substrate-binding protein n=1 Tax=Amycolatopsis sp. NPDC098790 TaxID=3363939 RepID=UPI0037F8E222
MESLERVQSDGSSSPLLAESVETPNPTTIVYRIRKSVTFSDGTPLTSEDVVWSIQHAFDAKSGAQSASTVTTIKNVAATGADTVTVSLTRPDPTARMNISLFAYIQEAKFARAQGDKLGSSGAVPIGTGPYKVDSFTADRISVSRNPAYWGQKPLMDKIDFVVIPDDNAAQLAMRSSTVQGAALSNPATAAQWKAISGTTVDGVPSVRSFFLSLDLATKPFDDIHVRKAIAYSIDRQGLLKSAFGEYGQVLSSLMPLSAISGVAPSGTEAEQFLQKLPQYDLDLSRARAELAQSAVPNGFRFSMSYPSTFAWAKLTLLNLQENLSKLGITLDLKSVTASEWANGIYAHKDLGAQVMTISSVPADPSGGLAYLVGKANAAAGATNTANYVDEKVEQAIQPMTNSTEKPARWDATRTILGKIAEDVPYLPLFEPQSTYALASGIRTTKAITVQDMLNGGWVYQLTR